MEVVYADNLFCILDKSDAICDFPFQLIGRRQQRCNRNSNLWEMILNYLPYFRQADTVVLMNQNVA